MIDFKNCFGSSDKLRDTSSNAGSSPFENFLRISRISAAKGNWETEVAKVGVSCSNWGLRMPQEIVGFCCHVCIIITLEMTNGETDWLRNSP